MKKILDSLSNLAKIADAVEQSWSIGGDGIEERALFFCDTSVQSATALAFAAKALGIDDNLLVEWSAAIAGSDALGLALRYDMKSIRLYSQYWVAITARVQSGDRTTFPLYRGFKSLTDGLVRRDTYMCSPICPPSVFWPPMADGFVKFNLDQDQARAVFWDLSAETAIFTQTEGEGRKSWLTTVRRANIDRAALADWLAPLAERAGGKAIIDAARSNDLMHIAGGKDTVKGPFITFYFESDVKTVLEKLAVPVN
jgi:hypothetical protein